MSIAVIFIYVDCSDDEIRDLFCTYQHPETIKLTSSDWITNRLLKKFGDFICNFQTHQSQLKELVDEAMEIETRVGLDDTDIVELDEVIETTKQAVGGTELTHNQKNKTKKIHTRRAAKPTVTTTKIHTTTTNKRRRQSEMPVGLRTIRRKSRRRLFKLLPKSRLITDFFWLIN